MVSLCIHAQFDIIRTNGQTEKAKGNIAFSNNGDAWKLNGVNLSEIKEIKRYVRSENEPIELHTSLQGIYFGDFWKEGYGDYYFALTNDRLGQIPQTNDVVPMDPGGYLLFVDIWAPLSDDSKNAILPEGKYKGRSGRANGCFTTEYSLAILNKEKTEQGNRFANILFTGGEMEVKHTDDGYDFTATVQTKEGKTLKFHYTGQIVFEDHSGDKPNDDKNVINTDVNLQPVLAQYMLYPRSTTDNYVLRLFDVSSITEDGVHPAVPGMKLNMDIYTAKGAGIEGTYRVGTKKGNYAIEEVPGVFFPGGKYGGITLGSFCERVNADMSVAYCSVVDGTLTIEKTEDGKYHVKADLISDKGKKVTCDWTGEIKPFGK